MFKKNLNKIINIGITPLLDKGDIRKIRLINFLAFVPLPLFLFSTIYCIVFDYLRIVYTNAAATLAMIIILLLNYYHKHTIAKIIFICSNSFIVFIYYKLMDNDVSMFYYYFPLILCFLIFYSPKDEKLALYFTASFLSLILMLTLYFPAAYFEPFPLSNNLHLFISRFNAVSCSAIIIIYTYNIFKRNKETETELIVAKELAEAATKAKTVFLSNMSHELRTPLNGIVGTANILNDDTTKNVKQHVQVMKNLAEHMTGLVNDILDYSKIESGKLELHNTTFNITEEIEKLHDLYHYQCEAKGIIYKTDIDERLKNIIVCSDDLRLQQILRNLISNAIKFTEKGVVTLSVTVVKQDPDFINVLFNIVDEGIGIASEKIEHIFDSFIQADTATTRKYGGSGLGLSISNSLLTLFKSKFYVNSIEGKGSNFFFAIKFPIHKHINIKNSSENKNTEIGNLLQNKKILLAEDNIINMKVAKLILQRWGVIVEEANNGKIALEKCKTENFDCILLDLEMPEMDGKTALKEINKLGQYIPAIAFTAAMYENMEADLLQFGFKGYALKPFKPEDLYNKIVSTLEIQP